MFVRLETARRAGGLLQRFGRSRAGNVAMIVGLVLIPIVIVSGMGVDYMRASSERTRLQQAVDATALSLAQGARSLSAADLQAKASQLFAANFATREGPMPQVVATKSGAEITVASQATMPTTLMKFAGQEAMTVHTTATVSVMGRQIELALVLDNTGSMGSSGKMTALKAAATMFLDQLAASNPAPGDIRITLVPYNMWVNVGKAAASAPWMDMSKASSSTWKGCVEERMPNYDINADSGATYPAVDCSTMPEEMLPLMDLTTGGALAALKQRVAAMDSDGSTNVQIGLIWGLSNLTPNSPMPGIGPRPFGTPGIDKILIVLTDGVNTSRRSRWGKTSSSVADQRTLMACTNVKDPAKKIRLITIRVVNGDDALLRQCASSPSDFYQAATASEVKPIFEAILNGLSKVRLVK